MSLGDGFRDSKGPIAAPPFGVQCSRLVRWWPQGFAAAARVPRGCREIDVQQCLEDCFPGTAIFSRPQLPEVAQGTDGSVGQGLGATCPIRIGVACAKVAIDDGDA